MMAGQTISDRLLAAKHSLAGQGLAKSVCKATTEEVLGPKKKHLDYLVHCTNEPNVSIPQMANLLIERSQNSNLVVVFKALITTHHLMCYGNERFTQYLASSNTTFNLSNFIDKSTATAVSANPLAQRATGYDMSPFIRRYAKYINEKALSYRLNAFDFCKMKRGKEEGTLRSLSTDKLLKTLPILQNQLDALLDFDCTINDLNNGVINMCFMLLFRDLIRLFASYNDAIINLLEKFFDMNKKQAREGLELYKKFLVRMDKVAEFLKVAESVGFNRGEIPDLTKAPSSLMDALEQHLLSLEGGNTTMTTSTSQKSLKSGVSALNTTGNSFGSVDDSFKQKALQDEEQMLNKFKTESAEVKNPFLFDDVTSPVITKPKSSNVDDILDLFDHSSNQQPSKVSGFNDFVDLNNPFAVSSKSSENDPNNLWMSDGKSDQVTNIFDNNNSIAASTSPVPAPQVTPTASATTGPPKLITDDLESSIARLAENLTLSPSKSRLNGSNWNQPNTTVYQPMNQQGNQPLFSSELATRNQQQQSKSAIFDPFNNL